MTEININPNKNTWPFEPGKTVCGVRLPEYLAWAAGHCPRPSADKPGPSGPLLLPPIQRGFVWNARQITELWDSLFRGMPIGSLMVSPLSATQEALSLQSKEFAPDTSGALGLMDGQQRTLAMLIGWPGGNLPNYCMWVDLSEAQGPAGAPFELRLTTQAQPFGFQRPTHGRLSRQDRRKARATYDAAHPDKKPPSEAKSPPDHALWSLPDTEAPRPWKATGGQAFARLHDLWRVFMASTDPEECQKQWASVVDPTESPPSAATWNRLYMALARMSALEVPLIMIPEHLSAPVLSETPPVNGPDPMVMLFERIGRNGASLSAEDLLFSMIKQQWPQAQTLINSCQKKYQVRAFMGPKDYVMTAFRLAMSEANLADNPRPDPHVFHRHLAQLMGPSPDAAGPLRTYIADESPLTVAFKNLCEALVYKPQSDNDAGLPLAMLAHLSRGLVQVLLRWAVRKSDAVVATNRDALIAFSLYWYLHVWHEDKATKLAFAVLGQAGDTEAFPAAAIYQALIHANDSAYELLPGHTLDQLLDATPTPALRSYDGIFRKDDQAKFLATDAQRDLYKRFCWARKPLLLWLQRAYVQKQFNDSLNNGFAGLTDEESVPYDFDHLCPQSHWGVDFRQVTNASTLTNFVKDSFKHGRSNVGNCIGNLHVLDASANRSFGDDALEVKLKSRDWSAEDSLLYHDPSPLVGDSHAALWLAASPKVDSDSGLATEVGHRVWTAHRLEKFQEAVYRRARGLYGQYAGACSLLDTQPLAD